ncbi:MAG: mannose-1-phosphate guanylyltransferase/mannose-6-phosphate isomerase [Candidatus Cryosericum sp.]
MKVIILAGGRGTRLWPMSRKSYAKQFLPLFGGHSLLEGAVNRALAVVGPEDVITVTNRDYYFYVKDALQSSAAEAVANIICEPEGRNTAPAIALAVQYAVEKMGAAMDETVFVFPSDHVIAPVDKFVSYLHTADQAARAGHLVTFGVHPTRPETGYGYVQVGEEHDGYAMCRRFTEKPTVDVAAEYIASGVYLWNAGMFAFTPVVFRKALGDYAPDIAAVSAKGYDSALEHWSDMPGISIDYAVMEKATNVAVVPMDLTWSDVGSWDSYYDLQKKDTEGNVLQGDTHVIDTHDSLVVSGKRLVAAVGLSNVTVIETDDAVLVTRRGDGQEVKQLLQTLENQHRSEATEHTEIIRPWGRYRVLEVGSRYKIKSIVVNVGATLSLQRHMHRTEHWVVIRGVAQVTIGEKTFLVHEGESTFVPKSILHRLGNPGKVPLEIIEVSNGEYVGEDDIERIEDSYGRADHE